MTLQGQGHHKTERTQTFFLTLTYDLEDRINAEMKVHNIIWIVNITVSQHRSVTHKCCYKRKLKQ